MKFRTGVIVGLAVGYYLGARAGRERYEQIEAWLDRARSTGPYQTLQDRAMDLADQSRERALQLVDDLVEDADRAAPDGDGSSLFGDPTLN